MTPNGKSVGKGPGRVNRPGEFPGFCKFAFCKLQVCKIVDPQRAKSVILPNLEGRWP